MARFSGCPSIYVRSPEGVMLDVYLAVSLRQRLLGLSWLAAPPPKHGLLIPHCGSVHTFGMRFPIDVAFVTWVPCERSVTVLAASKNVPPIRVTGLPKARLRRDVAAIELPAGALASLAIERGDRLTVAQRF